MMDKNVIRNNFSRCARYYDKYAGVQNNCALSLFRGLSGGNFTNILDIGCGTGILTGLLRARFPKAVITALDISGEMIDVAREKLRGARIRFITGDAEDVNIDGNFDLISSNASFQWFSDMEGALLKYKEKLRRNGIMAFSTFGPRTFCELNISLSEMLGAVLPISSSGFAGKKEVEGVMKRLFGRIKIEERIQRENFHSMRDLLARIKYSGIRGGGLPEKRVWAPESLKKLERIYIKKFEYLIVTYQVLFCRGTL